MARDYHTGPRAEKGEIPSGQDNRFSRVIYVVPSNRNRWDEEDLEKIDRESNKLFDRLSNDIKKYDENNLTLIPAPKIGTYFDTNKGVYPTKDHMSIMAQFHLQYEAWARHLFAYFIFDEFLRNWINKEPLATLKADDESGFLSILQDFIERQDRYNRKITEKELQRRWDYRNIFSNSWTNSYDKEPVDYRYVQKQYIKYILNRNPEIAKIANISTDPTDQKNQELNDAYTEWRLSQSTGYHNFRAWKEEARDPDVQNREQFDKWYNELKGEINQELKDDPTKTSNKYRLEKLEKIKERRVKENEFQEALEKKIAKDYYGIQNIDTDNPEKAKAPHWLEQWKEEEAAHAKAEEARKAAKTARITGNKSPRASKSSQKSPPPLPLQKKSSKTGSKKEVSERQNSKFNSNLRTLKVSEIKKSPQSKKNDKNMGIIYFSKSKSSLDQFKSLGDDVPKKIKASFKKVWEGYIDIYKEFLKNEDAENCMSSLDQLFTNSQTPLSNSLVDYSVRRLIAGRKTWFGLVSLKKDDYTMPRTTAVKILAKNFSSETPKKIFILYDGNFVKGKKWTEHMSLKTNYNEEDVQVEFSRQVTCDAFTNPESEESIWFIGFTGEASLNPEQKTITVQKMIKQYLFTAFQSFYLVDCELDSDSSDSKTKLDECKNTDDAKLIFDYFSTWFAFRYKFEKEANLKDKRAAQIFAPLFPVVSENKNKNGLKKR